MGSVQVTPKSNSYVEEWVAVQFWSKDGILPVKKLLKNTEWSIFEARLEGPSSQIVAARGSEFWRIHEGDWVVRSPHDKLWFMDNSEFTSQFFAEAES